MAARRRRRRKRRRRRRRRRRRAAAAQAHATLHWVPLAALALRLGLCYQLARANLPKEDRRSGQKAAGGMEVDDSGDLSLIAARVKRARGREREREREREGERGRGSRPRD